MLTVMALALPATAQAQQSRRVVVINGRNPVVRCDSQPTNAWERARQRARQDSAWERARQRARQDSAWERSHQRARARLNRIHQRADQRACRPPRAEPVPPRATYVNPWEDPDCQSGDSWGLPDRPARLTTVTDVTTGRSTRVYVAEPIYPGRQATPVHEVTTGRTTELPRAIATGRVDPWARTPRAARALTPETAASTLLSAFRDADWETACRLGQRLARGEVDPTRVQAAFWGLFPSPTLIRDARQGVTRHCADRASMLSLLRVLGDRAGANRGS
jgi:hypothetical protein